MTEVAIRDVERSTRELTPAPVSEPQRHGWWVSRVLVLMAVMVCVSEFLLRWFSIQSIVLVAVAAAVITEAGDLVYRKVRS